MPLPQLACFTDRRDSHKVQETEVGHSGHEEKINQIPEEPRVQQDLLKEEILVLLITNSWSTLMFRFQGTQGLI